jgi:predicted house-cleaning noncanonical NTP pyrophosphatase (MazG superfamily)
MTEETEEFMEDVYKKELGSNLETVDSGVAVGLIDFTQDSEYRRLYESQSDEETLERKGDSPPST